MIIKLLFWALSIFTTFSIVGVDYWMIRSLFEKGTYIQEMYFGAGITMIYSSPVWLLFIVGFFIFKKTLSKIEIIVFKALMICLLITVVVSISGIL